LDDIKTDNMQELKLLSFDVENKILQLAETYRQLKEEYITLKQKNKELKEVITKLEYKVKNQSEQLVKYKLNEKMNEEKKYTDVKLKINELVREIDMCIKLLNE
jgi:predicted RNase H-like nuclease (RuvC/YqgF family)